MFPQGDGTRIAFQQENPKRLGSGAYDLYERYKSSVTVGEARLKGCRQMDFNHDLKKGFLTILAGSGAQATQETPEAARAMPEVPKAVEGAAAEEPRGDAGQVPDTEAVGAAKPRSADGEAKPQAEERAAAPAEAKPPQTAEEALEALKAQPTDSQGLFIRTKGNAASRFVGVSVSKRTGRWEAKFAPAVGSAVILGQFDTEEAAAEAYRDAIFGKPPSAEQAAPGAAMPSAGEGKKEKASGEGGKAGRGADGGKAKEAAQDDTHTLVASLPRARGA